MLISNNYICLFLYWASQLFISCNLYNQLVQRLIIIKWDQHSGFYFHSYNNKQDVISALRAIRFVGGRTNIAEALEIAVCVEKRPHEKC